MSAVYILKATEHDTVLAQWQCRLGCTICGCTYWRHLANTNELFMCGRDVALCQVTFTTYYRYYFCLISTAYSSVLVYFCHVKTRTTTHSLGTLTLTFFATLPSI